MKYNCFVADNWEDLEVVELWMSDEYDYADDFSLQSKKYDKFKWTKPKMSNFSKPDYTKEDKVRQMKIIKMIVKGQCSKLKTFFYNEADNISKRTPDIEYHKVYKNLLNKPLDEQGNTALHLSAIHAQNDITRSLLFGGADPCIKNINHQTPYASTKNDTIKSTFKFFVDLNPDRQNYKKSLIPSKNHDQKALVNQRKLERAEKNQKIVEEKRKRQIELKTRKREVCNTLT